MAVSLIEGWVGYEGETEEGGKDEGAGQNKGEDEESLLGRMKKEQKGGYNWEQSKLGEKRLSHLEEGGGGTQRCTARRKLPGINLEVTARRMECGGERESWSQVRRGTSSPGIRVELKKNKGKERGDERRKSRERNGRQLLTNIWH